MQGIKTVLSCKITFSFCSLSAFPALPPSSRDEGFHLLWDCHLTAWGGILLSGLWNKITDLIFLETRESPCIILICKTLGLSSVTCWFYFSMRKWLPGSMMDCLFPLNNSQDGECPGVIDKRVQWEPGQSWWPSSSSPDKAGAVCKQHWREDYSHLHYISECIFCPVQLQSPGTLEAYAP